MTKYLYSPVHHVKQPWVFVHGCKLEREDDSIVWRRQWSEPSIPRNYTFVLDDSAAQNLCPVPTASASAGRTFMQRGGKWWCRGPVVGRRSRTSNCQRVERPTGTPGDGKLYPITNQHLRPLDDTSVWLLRRIYECEFVLYIAVLPLFALTVISHVAVDNKCLSWPSPSRYHPYPFVCWFVGLCKTYCTNEQIRFFNMLAQIGNAWIDLNKEKVFLSGYTYNLLFICSTFSSTTLN